MNSGCIFKNYNKKMYFDVKERMPRYVSQGYLHMYVHI